MPSTFAQLYADRMDRESDMIIRAAVPKVQVIGRGVTTRAVDAVRRGDPLDVKAYLLVAIQPVVRDAMIASYASGFKRERLTMRQQRIGPDVDKPRTSPAKHMIGRKPIKMAVYDELLKYLNKTGSIDPATLRNLFHTRAFDIATRLSDNANKRLRVTVNELLKSGAHVREGIEALRGRLGQDPGAPARAIEAELETVFRTQTQLAYNAGRWAFDQDPAIQEILWGYEYCTVGDDRVRETHEAVDGTVLRKDDPFWKLWWPPNGYNCRCVTVPIYDEEREPSIVMPASFTDSGEKVAPDAGFDFEPGRVLSVQAN